MIEGDGYISWEVVGVIQTWLDSFNQQGWVLRYKEGCVLPMYQCQFQSLKRTWSITGCEFIRTHVYVCILVAHRLLQPVNTNCVEFIIHGDIWWDDALMSFAQMTLQFSCWSQLTAQTKLSCGPLMRECHFMCRLPSLRGSGNRCPKGLLNIRP